MTARSVGVSVGVLLTFLAMGAVWRRLAGWRSDAVRRRRRGRQHAAVAVVVGALTLLAAPALVPVSVGAALALPPARRSWTARREQRAAEAELPEILESVARALRAGASLGQAVSEAPMPRSPSLCAEWARLRAAVPVAGVSGAVDAVWQPASGPPRRSGRQLVAGALRLAADVGGPQARALDLAAATLRQRLAFRDEVRAQAAQARASALVVALAPVAFALLAAATDPRYVPFLVRTVPGAVLLYAGLALDAAGWAWMTRLVRAGAER